jgi:hypothetical protein
MLNPWTNERELAYIVQIDEIRPIENYDRVEHARVGGWWVIAKKDQFKVGDLAIYIEVDSKVPEIEPFMFLEKRNFRVKTLKMCGVISQGLLMHPEDFGWKNAIEATGEKIIDWGHSANDPMPYLNAGDFVTKELGITYYEPEDNKRKGKGPDKYAKMAQRRPDIFKKKWARWMMRRNWGKKVMFKFFGKKKDKRTWPSWVKKTDEERCQNMPWLFPGNPDQKWMVTEKIDGSSTTFTIKRGKRKNEFYVCSRNVMFDTPEKAEKCFYDSNIYLEMAEKYNMEETMNYMLDIHTNVDFITIQGETYGEGVQKRDYGLKGRDFMAFNLIFGYADGRTERCNPVEMTEILSCYKIPCVPIIIPNYYMEGLVLPETCDELLAFAEGLSEIDGDMREGLVFRSFDGEQSFKAVSNKFLLKYHS